MKCAAQDLEFGVPVLVLAYALVSSCIIQPSLLGAPNNGGGKNLILREIERVSTESLNVTSSD